MKKLISAILLTSSLYFSAPAALANQSGQIVFPQNAQAERISDAGIASWVMTAPGAVIWNTEGTHSITVPSPRILTLRQIAQVDGELWAGVEFTTPGSLDVHRGYIHESEIADHYINFF